MDLPAQDAAYKELACAIIISTVDELTACIARGQYEEPEDYEMYASFVSTGLPHLVASMQLDFSTAQVHAVQYKLQALMAQLPKPLASQKITMNTTTTETTAPITKRTHASKETLAKIHQHMRNALETGTKPDLPSLCTAYDMKPATVYAHWMKIKKEAKAVKAPTQAVYKRRGRPAKGNIVTNVELRLPVERKETLWQRFKRGVRVILGYDC
jgi:hypothetical protein